VCARVRTVTFERNDLSVRYLARRFNSRTRFRSSSTVNVIIKIHGHITGSKLFLFGYWCSRLKSQSEVGKPVTGKMENASGNDTVPISVRRGGGMRSSECCCSSWSLIQFFVQMVSVQTRLKVTSDTAHTRTHCLTVVCFVSYRRRNQMARFLRQPVRHWRRRLLGTNSGRAAPKWASTVACPTTLLPQNLFFFHFILNTYRQ